MSNTNMRLFLIIPLFTLPFIASLAYAEEDKGGRGSSEQHTTQHPPHDHHQTDHLKKLDEGLARRRQHKKSLH